MSLKAHSRLSAGGGTRSCSASRSVQPRYRAGAARTALELTEDAGASGREPPDVVVNRARLFVAGDGQCRRGPAFAALQAVRFPAI